MTSLSGLFISGNPSRGVPRVGTSFPLLSREEGGVGKSRCLSTGPAGHRTGTGAPAPSKVSVIEFDLSSGAAPFGLQQPFCFLIFTSYRSVETSKLGQNTL